VCWTDFGGACLSRLRIFSWTFYLDFSGLLCLCFAVLGACVLHQMTVTTFSFSIEC